VQLQHAVVARGHDLDRDVVGVVHETLGHVAHEVAELEVLVVGLALDTLTGGARRPDYFGGDGGAIGTDDNRSPLQKSRIVNGTDRRSVTSG